MSLFTFGFIALISTACGKLRDMSKQVAIDTPAPDFTLPDFEGNEVTLSDYRGRRHVLLVLNRGFA